MPRDESKVSTHRVVAAIRTMVAEADELGCFDNPAGLGNLALEAVDVIERLAGEVERLRDKLKAKEAQRVDEVGSLLDRIVNDARMPPGAVALIAAIAGAAAEGEGSDE